MQVKLSDVKIWQDNYNEGDVGGIALSIRKFGFNNAPRLWKDLEARGGNHTVLALRQLKQAGEPAPKNVAEIDGEWYINAIDISHLPEADALAFAIADNQLARHASRDEGLLIDYLMQVRDSDHSAFLATGFDDEDLDYLTQSARVEVTQDEGLPPEDKMDVYLHNTIKQVVLYFQAAEYVTVIDKMERIKAELSVPDNSSLFMRLMDWYDERKMIIVDEATTDPYNFNHAKILGHMDWQQVDE